MTKKDPYTIVGSFTKQINEAIKGGNIAQDVKSAVMGLLKAYEIPIPNQEAESYKKPELHKEPDKGSEKKLYYTNPPVQKGHLIER
jgi:hypothetical protein